MKKLLTAMVKPFTLGIIAVAIFTLSHGPAQAGPVAFTPLPPGSMVVPITTTWIAAGDVLLATTGNVAVANASYSGTARSDVYMNGLGTLDFYYQFSNSAVSLNAINRLSMFNFGGFTTDVAQIQLGTSIAGGGFVDGTLVLGAADTANRDVLPGESLGFNFNQPLPALDPGVFSYVFVIRTNATAFTVGNFGIIDGITTNVPAFQPAPAAPVPEPASMLLLGAGLAGAAGTLRRRLF